VHTVDAMACLIFYVTYSAIFYSLYCVFNSLLLKTSRCMLRV